MIKQPIRALAATLVLGLSIGLPVPAEAGPKRNRPPATTTTVFTAPFDSPTRGISGCANYVNLNATCREMVTADENGASSQSIIVDVGEHAALNSHNYSAYTSAVWLVPVTTTTPRTSLSFEVSVHIDAASSVMDRARYAWGWGVPQAETIVRTAVASSNSAYIPPFTEVETVLTRFESESMTDTHLEQRVTNEDRHLSFSWAPAGGIPPGTHRVWIQLLETIDAASNGSFRSTLDATVDSLTVTER